MVCECGHLGTPTAGAENNLVPPYQDCNTSTPSLLFTIRRSVLRWRGRTPSARAPPRPGRSRAAGSPAALAGSGCARGGRHTTHRTTPRSIHRRGRSDLDCRSEPARDTAVSTRTPAQVARVTCLPSAMASAPLNSVHHRSFAACSHAHRTAHYITLHAKDIVSGSGSGQEINKQRKFNPTPKKQDLRCLEHAH